MLIIVQYYVSLQNTLETRNERTPLITAHYKKYAVTRGIGTTPSIRVPRGISSNKILKRTHVCTYVCMHMYVSAYP